MSGWFSFGVPKIVTGLPRWLSGKASACQAGDMGLLPGSERSSLEGNSNPPSVLPLENPVDRGALWATVDGMAKESDTT